MFCFVFVPLAEPKASSTQEKVGGVPRRMPVAIKSHWTIVIYSLESCLQRAPRYAGVKDRLLIGMPFLRHLPSVGRRSICYKCLFSGLESVSSLASCSESPPTSIICRQRPIFFTVRIANIFTSILTDTVDYESWYIVKDFSQLKRFMSQATSWMPED